MIRNIPKKEKNFRYLRKLSQATVNKIAEVGHFQHCIELQCSRGIYIFGDISRTMVVEYRSISTILLQLKKYFHLRCKFRDHPRGVPNARKSLDGIKNLLTSYAPGTIANAMEEVG